MRFFGAGQGKATPNEWVAYRGLVSSLWPSNKVRDHGDRTESVCLETPDARTYHKSRCDLFMKGLVDGCLKQRERAFLLPIRTPASDTRQTQDSEEAPNVTPTFMAASESPPKDAIYNSAPVVKKGSGAIIPLTLVLTRAIYDIGFHEEGRPDA